MRKELRIVSDGLSNNTHVYCGDDEIEGVQKIVIEPIQIDGYVRATITIEKLAIDIKAKEAGITVVDPWLDNKIQEFIFKSKA